MIDIRKHNSKLNRRNNEVLTEQRINYVQLTTEKLNCMAVCRDTSIKAWCSDGDELCAHKYLWEIISSCSFGGEGFG